MPILTRLKRAAKEILGRKQWPRLEAAPRPSNYEEQIYAGLVRPGDTCFDVGANVGDVSLFLAKLVGGSGLVVAFEPVWPVYVQLCHNVQCDTTLKSPIITIPTGLADTEKEATIQVPNGKFGMGSMADATAWENVQAGDAIDAYQSRFTTIDSFLSKTGLQAPMFMKIDVEGAELFVLRGAVELFSGEHLPLMLIEVFAPWEKAFGYQPWEPFHWLLERGYRFLFACPSGLVEHLPTEARPFPPQHELGYNIVAYIPDAHGVRLEGVRHLRAGHLTKLLPMDAPPMPNTVR